MIDLLKRMIDTQAVLVVLAGLAAIALRVGDLVSGAECVDVFKTGLWTFAAGTVLREGIGALASKGAA